MKKDHTFYIVEYMKKDFDLSLNYTVSVTLQAFDLVDDVVGFLPLFKTETDAEWYCYQNHLNNNRIKKITFTSRGMEVEI